MTTNDFIAFACVAGMLLMMPLNLWLIKGVWSPALRRLHKHDTGETTSRRSDLVADWVIVIYLPFSLALVATALLVIGMTFGLPSEA